MTGYASRIACGNLDLAGKEKRRYNVENSFVQLRKQRIDRNASGSEVCARNVRIR